MIDLWQPYYKKSPCFNQANKTTQYLFEKRFSLAACLKHLQTITETA